MTPTPSESPGSAGQLLCERFSVAELVNTICHDVRATLAVTAGSATELSSPDFGPLSDMQRQLIAIIQRGNARLARLANNLMYIGELWSGSLELKPTRCDLRTLVQQVTAELRQKDTTSRVQLALDLPADPVMVEVDIERTRQALVNPIGIALSAAQRTVGLRLRAEAGRAELFVEDDGPERGGKPSPSAVKRVSSNELALAVSEGLLGPQAGSLILESPIKDGGGTRVTLTLPLAPAV